MHGCLRSGVHAWLSEEMRSGVHAWVRTTSPRMHYNPITLHLLITQILNVTQYYNRVDIKYSSALINIE